VGTRPPLAAYLALHLPPTTPSFVLSAPSALWRNSLPELGDGGGEVGGVGGQPEGFVLAEGVLDAAVGVPGLVALGPGQLRLETLQRGAEEGQLVLAGHEQN